MKIEDIQSLIDLDANGNVRVNGTKKFVVKYSDIENIPLGGAGNWGAIGGNIGDQADLTSLLVGKADIHPHPYAANIHPHAIEDIAELTTALSDKSDKGHSHPDSWTYVKLAADHSTTSIAAQNTLLAFAPAQNQTYIVEGVFLTRTATTTVGPRIGISWPVGCLDGAAGVQQTSSATANNFANGNIAAPLLSPVGGLPTTTGSFPSLLWATLITGNSTGNFTVQLASETNGTSVIMRAGSWIRYRTI